MEARHPHHFVFIALFIQNSQKFFEETVTEDLTHKTSENRDKK